VEVEGHPVSRVDQVTRQMYQRGAWFSITYSLLRGSIPLEVKPILGVYHRASDDWLRTIALIYLGIGLYVLFRRWTAPGSSHFYLSAWFPFSRTRFPSPENRNCSIGISIGSMVRLIFLNRWCCSTSC